MPSSVVEGEKLVVRLNWLERLGALYFDDLQLSLERVRRVEASEDVFAAVKGLRVGTGVPRLCYLGRFYHDGVTDFVAAVGDKQGWIAVLDDSPESGGFARLIISGAPPEDLLRSS
mmetsp:Transcript_12656/g.31187  ORF Transcript_12656/g.31187 Transcript_12656/m.31187 type:complete len:116 (-) Transcript_12656:88-435(-)